MEVDYVALGQRIRSHRCALHLTQEELAERVGISASFLGHIERGSRVLSVETLWRCVRRCPPLRMSCWGWSIPHWPHSCRSV